MYGVKHLTIFSSLPMQVYMIHNIKKPILEGKKIALRNIDRLPEPTVENTWHPNTHNLLILRDWFFKHWFIKFLCIIPFIKRFLTRSSKFIIILYDFDPPWRWIFDSVKDKALELESDRWGDNLSYLRDWLLSHCGYQVEAGGYKGLHLNRTELIEKIFNMGIKFCNLGGNGFIKNFMKEARLLEWEPRGFEDTWEYGWWRE